jgi:hypothetical protein
MKTLWNEETRLEILQRVGSVRDDALPKWGKMSAGAMLCHLSRSLSMCLGELPVAPKNLPLRYFPLKQLIIYVFPFPKGAPTAPELLVKTPEPCGRGAAEIGRLLADFAACGKREVWPDHPAFGPLDAKAWGALTYKHFNHHLRQFGV